MRIDTISYSNVQTQGAQQRAWLRQHSPQHLEQSASLILHALEQRSPSASRSTLVLGAGACTEVPLVSLCRASEEVVLADLDLAAIQRGRAELSSPAQRKQMHLIQDDLTGGVSAHLAHLLRLQHWQDLISQGPQAVFDAAAQCLEQCPVPDPPQVSPLAPGEFGLIVSALILSQLFSYPLLDVLDHVQRISPSFLGEQERHRRYQDAAQSFRVRVINAHLHLLRDLLDAGGAIALLSDVRGFVFNVYGTDHDAAHRRALPLVPRIFPELVRNNFMIVEEAQWEWLTDLPEKDRPGRGYEVAGYILKAQ